MCRRSHWVNVIPDGPDGDEVWKVQKCKVRLIFSLGNGTESGRWTITGEETGEEVGTTKERQRICDVGLREVDLTKRTL